MAKQSEVLIHKTEEYDLFKQLEGNRPLNKGLIRSLHESIENDGNYLQYNPILVNEDMEVIDGQHRLKVAKELEKPIYYIVAEGFRLKQAQILNSRKRDWKAADYLHALLAQGDRDAQILNDFMQEYKMSIAICVKLLGKSFTQVPMKRFREGTFTVVDIAWAQNAAGLLSTIREHSPDYAFAHTACIQAVARMMDILPDPKVFEKKLTQYQMTITRRASARDYLRQFELILNSGGEGNKFKLL